MLGAEKNLKDSQKNSEKDTSFIPALYGQAAVFSLGSYTKTHKLITALYMVTDIIDKEEPLRHKLRTLGTGIISDMHLVQQNNTGYTMSFIFHKVSEVIHFLDIASAVNIISEMNCNILRKEFFELNEAIKESINKDEIADRRQIDLSEFFKEEDDVFHFPLNKGEAGRGFLNSPHSNSLLSKERRNYHGHSTRIGVQKGSTLMKALNEKMSKRSEVIGHSADVFDELKKERRDSIINIIKTIGTGATIKDIKDKANTMPEQFKSLMSVSEKTLQRELISMVQNGVLNKTGEKRWSRYFVKISS